MIKGFGEIGVGIHQGFLDLKRDTDVVLESLLAFLDLFEGVAEPLVLLTERDSDEVDGFVAGVFEIAFWDVDVAVAAREFAEGDDLVPPFFVCALDGVEVSRLDSL